MPRYKIFISPGKIPCPLGSGVKLLPRSKLSLQRYSQHLSLANGRGEGGKYKYSNFVKVFAWQTHTIFTKLLKILRRNVGVSRRFAAGISIFTVIILFFWQVQPVLALEIIYPNLGPGFPSLNTLPPDELTLALYIQYIFIFIMLVAGIIGVMVIVIHGFRILLYAGSPAKIDEARKGIFNAILGIVILMTSFILLKTINPSLVSPTGSSLPLQPGIYLRGSPPGPIAFNNLNNHKFIGVLTSNIAYAEEIERDEFFTKAPRRDNDDTDTEILGFDDFVYICYPGSGKDILVWDFNKPNFYIDANATTTILRCGNVDPYTEDPNYYVSFLDVESYYWDYESAGVYYYMAPDCTGVSSYFGIGSPSQTFSADIPWFNEAQKDEIDQSVQSVRILNDQDQDFNYGLILNQSVNFSGECSEPIINTNLGDPNVIPDPGSLCINIGDPAHPETIDLDGVGFNPWSAYIIRQTRNPNSERNQGITFWAPHLYLSLDQISATESLTIGPKYIYKDNFDSLIKNEGENWYEGVEDVPNDECCPVELDENGDLTSSNPECIDGDGSPFYDSTYLEKGYNSCIDYLTIDGEYDVVIYTKNDITDDRICSIINDSVIFNTKLYSDTGSIAPPYYLDHSKSIYKMVVIPNY